MRVFARLTTTVKSSNHKAIAYCYSSSGTGSKALTQYQCRSFSSTHKKTDFGFREVDADDKESMVRDIFSKVASKYDVMNDFMSLGTHRLWKDDLVRSFGYNAAAKVDPMRIPRHLDVAGGTGDVAFRSLNDMLKNYSSLSNISAGLNTQDYNDEHERQVVVCDINPEMLEVGKTRIPKQIPEGHENLIGFVEGNAEALPFDSDSFDLYTIAFGLRNVTNKDKAIREAYRVLRKGGRLMILEFSHVNNAVLRRLYDQYSFNVIPELGHLVANDRDSYRYLVESIRNFPKQEELRAMITAEGFEFSTYTNYTFGVVAVHSGYKI